MKIFITQKKYAVTITALSFLWIEALCYFYIDPRVSLFFRNLDATYPAFIGIFRNYTELGQGKWYLWPTGIGVLSCAAALRCWRISAAHGRELRKVGETLLYLFLCVAISGLITDILKIIIGRARPVEFIRYGTYGFHPFTFTPKWHSLPSGHTTTAMALACALSHLSPRYRFLWIGIAVLLILSRIVVNAHYVGDLFAGCLVGYLTVWAVSLQWRHHGINLLFNSFFPIEKNRRFSRFIR